jgi:hypothetical protein
MRDGGTYDDNAILLLFFLPSHFILTLDDDDWGDYGNGFVQRTMTEWDEQGLPVIVYD